MTYYVYLSYAPRSGSTKLASLLAETSQDLVVVPEFRAAVTLAQHAVARELTSRKLADLLRDDRQLRDLGVAVEQIVDRDEPGTITVGDALDRIVDAYTVSKAQSARSSRSVVLLKHGGAIERFSDIIDALPGTRVVFLTRDPRAVANSMIRSVVPRDARRRTFAMGNPRYPIRKWRRRHNAYVRAARIAPRAVRLFQYEDLSDTAAVEALCSWLDCEVPRDSGRQPPERDRDGEQPSSYLEELPVIERQLHPLVMEDFRRDRASAWMSELAPDVASDVETLLWSEMQALGYGVGPKPDWRERSSARWRDARLRPLEVARRAQRRTDETLRRHRSPR